MEPSNTRDRTGSYVPSYLDTSFLCVFPCVIPEAFSKAWDHGSLVSAISWLGEIVIGPQWSEIKGEMGHL